MKTQLLKMGAPLKVMTAEIIERERDLFTKTRYNVSHRAREIGVKQTTLRHHLRDLLMGACISEGRIIPKVAALIEAGNRLCELAPATPESVEARRDWFLARTAITKRKSNIQ